MPRNSETLIQHGTGYNTRSETPMASPIVGNQMGYATDPANAISDTKYVKRPIIAVLIAPPRGYDELENPELWKSTLKRIIETGAKTIEGLRSTLSVEFTSSPLGGHEEQEDIAKVKRERSAVSFTWVERYGKPIARFIDGTIYNLYGDPETGTPRAAAAAAAAGRRPDMLSDWSGFTVLYMEPDPTHTTILEAWLITNQHFKKGADNEGGRDLTATPANTEYTIELTGHQQVNDGVVRLAQSIFDDMNEGLTAADPNRRNPSHDGVDAEAVDLSGYKETIQDLVNNQID